MGVFTVGIDLDNTVWALGERALELLNEMYHANIPFDECEYNIDKTFSKRVVNFTKGIMDGIYLNAAYDAKVYPYAQDVINAIEEDDRYEVYFCTSSTTEESHIKHHRLLTMFDWYNQDRLIVTSRKELVAFDYFIDDLPKYFSHNHKKDYMMLQPYNSVNTDVVPNVIYNWLDMYDELGLHGYIRKGDAYDSKET